MYSTPFEPAGTVPFARRQGCPHYQIVAAVARPDTDSGITLLSEAGFARERIEVVVVEEVPRLEELIGGTGLHRFLVRLQLIRGDDLDQLEQARRDLMNGYALIQVLALGDAEQHLAQAILFQHGSRHSRYFDVWTIQSPNEW